MPAVPLGTGIAVTEALIAHREELRAAPPAQPRNILTVFRSHICLHFGNQPVCSVNQYMDTVRRDFTHSIKDSPFWHHCCYPSGLAAGSSLSHCSQRRSGTAVRRSHAETRKQQLKCVSCSTENANCNTIMFYLLKHLGQFAHDHQTLDCLPGRGRLEAYRKERFRKTTNEMAVT